MPRIVSEETDQYLSSIKPPTDDLVREMEAHANEEGIPIAGRSLATLQEIFAVATDASLALEFGTAIGYSTLFLARMGVDVVTMEVDDDRIDAAVEYLERDDIDVTVTEDVPTEGFSMSHDGEVTIVSAPALQTVKRLSGTYDLVFIDAVKTEYEAYFHESLPLLRSGGVMIVDNLLRAGKVATFDADKAGEYAESVAAIHAFNQTFFEHPELSSIITPQGDGIGIAVKARS